MTPVSPHRKPKTHQPSSPRDFFQRLYGDLEDKNENQQEHQQTVQKSREVELVAPIPILATPFPLLFPHGNESQLAVAAAGLTAFCKYFYYIYYKIF